MWYVTCDMWGGVNILSKCQLPSSYSLVETMFWRYVHKWRLSKKTFQKTASDGTDAYTTSGHRDLKTELAHWKYTRAFELEKLFFKTTFYFSYPVWTPKSWQHTAHCTLHLHLHLYVHMYTSYYTLNTLHCTSYIYSTCCTLITSHFKHPKFVWVALKIYKAKAFM